MSDGDPRPGALERRAFLRALVELAAAGVWLGPLAACARDPLREQLGAFYAEREAAAALGRLYLEANPGESDPELLMERLAGGIERPRSDAAALARHLRARHRADFEHGRLTSLDGWLLSQTEARLCALAALA